MGEYCRLSSTDLSLGFECCHLTRGIASPPIVQDFHLQPTLLTSGPSFLAHMHVCVGVGERINKQVLNVGRWKAYWAWNWSLHCISNKCAEWLESLRRSTRNNVSPVWPSWISTSSSKDHTLALNSLASFSDPTAFPTAFSHLGILPTRTRRFMPTIRSPLLIQLSVGRR